MPEFLESSNDLRNDLRAALLDDRLDDRVDDHAAVVLVDVGVFVEILGIDPIPVDGA